MRPDTIANTYLDTHVSKLVGKKAHFGMKGSVRAMENRSAGGVRLMGFHRVSQTKVFFRNHNMTGKRPRVSRVLGGARSIGMAHQHPPAMVTGTRERVK